VRRGSRANLIGREMKMLGDKCDVELTSARLRQMQVLFVTMCNPPTIPPQTRGSGTPAERSAARRAGESSLATVSRCLKQAEQRHA
jgi:hypothetical protein